MGIYDGMGDAKISNKLPSLGEGKYVVQIEKIGHFPTRAGYNATCAEFSVLESSNADHPVGVKRSYFQKMNVDAAMGALKQFACALSGIDPKDTAKVKEQARNLEEFLELAISKENPARGLRVGVNLVKITTKDGKPFGKHDWFPVAQAA